MLTARPRIGAPEVALPREGGPGAVHWHAWVWVLGSALLWPLGANAMTELMLQLDSSLRFDSNPLRFTDDANIAAALGRDRKSDTIFANDIRAALVQPLDSPQTRLILTGQLGRRNYSQLTQLDNTEYAYRAAFEWRWGELWRGEMGHREEQQLYNYLNGSLTTLEMVQTKTDNLEVALRVTPDIELPVTFRNRRFDYQTAVNQVFNSQERVVDAGLRYQTTTRSSLRAGLRSTTVNFPTRDAAQIATLDRGYVDTEIYAETDWQYSVMTRFSGRLASLTRRYDTLGAKNFSALTTELHALHDYSPLTRLTLDVWSRPYGLTDPTILYTTALGAQLGVRWQATAKTRVSVQAINELQRYQYAALAAGQTNPELNRVRLGGGLVYALSRDVRVYADGYHERINRGTLGADIAQTFVRAGVEYTFENIDGLAKRSGFGERR